MIPHKLPIKDRQSPALSMEHKQRLQERKLQLNPFNLKRTRD